MNIVPELNLNKHPKDCKNLSLVNATNIRLSDDASCLQNEEILVDSVINSIITSNSVIYGIIPCNTEYVVFYTQNSNENAPIYIARVNDKTGAYVICGIYGVKGNSSSNPVIPTSLEKDIIGTFTYNINNDLIISFTDKNYSTPLQTLNLGYWDRESSTINDSSRSDIKTYSNTNYLDSRLSPLCPEVELPNIVNCNYVKGTIHKGWYHFFIRYKINFSDYTQWYHIGYPIFISDLKKQNIIKYLQWRISATIVTPTREVENKPFGSGASDIFVDNLSDISTETIKFTLSGLDNKYSSYQIGFICVSTDYQGAGRTNDLDLSNTVISINSKLFIDYSVNDIILKQYNYYGVKNIINYKNRLYISNYRESLFDYSELQSYADNIKLDVVASTVTDNSLREASNQVGKEVYDVEEEQEEHTYTIPANAGLVNDDVGSMPIAVGDVIRLKYENVYCVYDTDDNNHFCTHVSEERRDNDMDFYVYFNFGGYYATYRITGIYNGRENEIRVTQIYNPIVRDITVTEGGSGTIVNKIKYINTNKTFNSRKVNRTLIPGGIYNIFIHYVDKYGIATNGYKISKVDVNATLETVLNYNGDVLFRVPDSTPTVVNGKYQYTKYKLKVSNITIPNGYVGCYFSYEKYQKNKIEGIISLSDANTSGNAVHSYKTFVANGKMYFYGADLDLDAVSLNYNKLRVYGVSSGTIIGDFTTQNKIMNDHRFEFFTNLNAPQVNASSNSYIDYDITGIEYRLGGDAKYGRVGKGTCIALDVINALFENTPYAIYKVALINTNNENFYINEEKELIKFSNIYKQPNGPITIDEGYNGYLTFNNFLVYDNSGVNLTEENVAVLNISLDDLDSFKGNTPYHLPIIDVAYDAKFLAYIQLPVISDILYESKQFKNDPVTRIYTTSIKIENNTETLGTSIGSFVLPQNSIDLFENRFKSQDYLYPVSYYNYNPKSYNLAEFNKTVRRSSVIADESSINNWRYFPPEAYKQIIENRGNITNLIGIGSTLLVHTEHSLFAFIRNNRLRSNEERLIQLETPDIFDIDYQEIFTSSLGSCGLQDGDAYIADEFGYYFYDNDAHRFYRFSTEKVDVIDNTIIQFLDKYKPSKVRFGADKNHSRLLINIVFNVGTSPFNITLSYHYGIGSFISAHTLNFDKAWCTKTKCTYKKITGLSIPYSYVEYDTRNIHSVQYQNIFNLDIIINDTYDLIKVLEFIMYKLYKVTPCSTHDFNPVEDISGQRKSPFSGNYLRVFNDLTDTGNIDISCEEVLQNIANDNYLKPYFDLGNWNFSYLRDSNDIDGERQRLHGNYFILEFSFVNNSNKLIEFESLEYNVIKYR